MVHIVQHIGFKALSTELVELYHEDDDKTRPTQASAISIIKRRGRCNLTCRLITSTSQPSIGFH